MAAWIASFTLHAVAAAAILNQLSTIFIFLLAVAMAFGGAIPAWLA